MKHTLTALLCLFCLYTLKAQTEVRVQRSQTRAPSSWKTTSIIATEESHLSSLVWNHKGKLWISTTEQVMEGLKKEDFDPDAFTLFVGKNRPDERTDAIQWATENELWLFGGLSAESHQYLNDLWVYHITTDTWEQVKSENTMPEARTGAAGWKQGSETLWMFGGMVENSKSPLPELSNELWSFDLKSRQWKKYENKEGPSARTDMAVWEASPDKILVYGGFGSSENGKSGLSDLWEFDLNTEKWTITDTGKRPPFKKSYGSRSIPVHPGHRVRPVTWTDSEGNHWLTLGQSTAAYNQISIDAYLWRLNPDDYSWNYTPVEPGRYVTQASAVFEDPKKQTWMVFPTYVNANAEQRKSLSVNQLLKRN